VTHTLLWVHPHASAFIHAKRPPPSGFVQTPFSERQASFSPDGHWLAYSSNESGTDQIYVRAFPDKGGKWQISNTGGLYPKFSPSGRELFFRPPGDNQLVMVASYSVQGDSFVADKPRVWYPKPIAQLLTINYDVALDGKRIAALMPSEGAAQHQASGHVIFLENFFDELRRRVPVSK